MATAMISSQLNQGTVSPIDALWSLYCSMNKRARKAFRVRVLAEEDTAVKAQQKMVKKSLTKAFDELHAGQAKHNARNLFAE